MTNEIIWLDDLRDPTAYVNGTTPLETYCPIPIEGKEIVWIKNGRDFIYHIYQNGIPSAVCFDHDLGDSKPGDVSITGYDCAMILIENLKSLEMDVIPYACQSSNPVGKKRIQDAFESYHKFYKKYIEKK